MNNKQKTSLCYKCYKKHQHLKITRCWSRAMQILSTYYKFWGNQAQTLCGALSLCLFLRRTLCDSITHLKLYCISQQCPTLCSPMDSSLPDSSVHGILQARILGLVAFAFSRRSSQPRYQTWVSCTAGRFFTV